MTVRTQVALDSVFAQTDEKCENKTTPRNHQHESKVKNKCGADVTRNRGETRTHRVADNRNSTTRRLPCCKK